MPGQNQELDLMIGSFDKGVVKLWTIHVSRFHFTKLRLLIEFTRYMSPCLVCKHYRIFYSRYDRIIRERAVPSSMPWWMSRWLLFHANEQFFNYIMTRTSYVIEMRWRWWRCPLCTRPTRCARFFSASSLV